MVVELINTGSELLLGSVLNTHLRFLAQALLPLGLRISRQVTVPDGDAIRETLLESFSRSEIVIVTGGLGPTTDDITREVAADLLGLQLVHDPEIMHAIEARFSARGLAVSKRVDRQAQRPEGATVLANDHGTAPGLYFPPQLRDGRNTPHLFLLPGPPRELEPMFHAAALPLIEKISLNSPAPSVRIWRVAGLGESQVEERVGESLLELGIELGYCARPGEVDLRVIGSEDQIHAAGEIIARRIYRHVVSNDGSSVEQALVQLLTERKQTVATAESCTGGCIADRLTDVPGCSSVFLAGYVTYSNESKFRALDVDPAIIRQNGAVSHQVAAAMAAGAMRKANSTYAIATTGIAGPSGGSIEKPVGTVYIALATRQKSIEVQRHRFGTDRKTFKELTAITGLDFLRRTILES